MKTAVFNDRDAKFLDVAAEALNKAADDLHADNDHAEFHQRQDLEKREMETLQALMKVAAAGLHAEADTLARESGVWQQWTAPIKTLRIVQPRPDGMPF